MVAKKGCGEGPQERSCPTTQPLGGGASPEKRRAVPSEARRPLVTATRSKSEARRSLHPVRPAGSHRVGASVDGRGEVGQSRPSPELVQYSAVWSPWRPHPGTPARPSSTGLWGDAVPFKAGFQMASGLSASARLTQSPEEQEMLLRSEVVLMLSPKQCSCPDDSRGDCL